MLCFGSEEEHGSLALLKGFSAIPQPVPGRPPFSIPMVKDTSMVDANNQGIYLSASYSLSMALKLT